MERQLSKENVESLIEDAKKEVRKELISKFSKYFVAGLVGIGTLAAIGGWTLLLPWLRAQTGGAPPGSIIALDRSDLTEDKCPQGWEPFLHARGRVIVGAGDPSKAPRKFGIGLTEYDLRQHGGIEKIDLQIKNLPPHDHENTTLVSVTDGLDSVTINSGDMEQRKSRSGKTGDGVPIDNRQPFIALFYCKKT